MYLFKCHQISTPSRDVGGQNETKNGQHIFWTQLNSWNEKFFYFASVYEMLSLFRVKPYLEEHNGFTSIQHVEKLVTVSDQALYENYFAVM